VYRNLIRIDCVTESPKRQRRKALENAGVRFIAAGKSVGAGVRLRE
jgi:hypothetical protein